MEARACARNRDSTDLSRIKDLFQMNNGIVSHQSRDNVLNYEYLIENSLKSNYALLKNVFGLRNRN